jgi:hypothetical protein
MLPSGRVTGMLLMARWTLTRRASMVKKWPVLPVLAMLADKGVDGEEPGRFVGSFRNYRV